MAPIYKNDLEIPWLEIVELLPYPVWIDDPQEAGNIVTNSAYEEDLGCNDREGWTWDECVCNKSYSRSYKIWRERGPQAPIWRHKLQWRRPDNGEIVERVSRARWTEDGYIFGVVEPLEITKADQVLHYSFRALISALTLAGAAWLVGFLHVA